MITITMNDWSGLHMSVTKLTEQELGYTGDVARLERMAQNVASEQTAIVKIEQDGKLLASASYLTAIL